MELGGLFDNCCKWWLIALECGNVPMRWKTVTPKKLFDGYLITMSTNTHLTCHNSATRIQCMMVKNTFNV